VLTVYSASCFFSHVYVLEVFFSELLLFCAFWNARVRSINYAVANSVLFAFVGLKEGSSHPYPHTLFMDYGTWWSVPQRNASMLMFSFGYALALAKQKYGVFNCKSL
jgi:hypothetical protein